VAPRPPPPPKVIQLGGGRPRKPTAHKRLAGTLRNDRQNHAEPRLQPIALPDPPADLTDLERAAWVELKELIDPMQIATAADVVAFRSMVEDAGMLAALRKSFIDSGSEPVTVEETKAGAQLRMRPEVLSIPTYRKLMLLHFVRWGISPADRQRVSVLSDPTAKKQDPLGKYRVGGAK
jgi:hypothetical protein